MSHYYPRHVSGLDMPILRRKNIKKIQFLVVVTSVLPSSSVHLRATRDCTQHSHNTSPKKWNSQYRPCLQSRRNFRHVWSEIVEGSMLLVVIRKWIKAEGKAYLHFIKHRSKKAYARVEICPHSFWTTAMDVNGPLHTHAALCRCKRPLEA